MAIAAIKEKETIVRQSHPEEEVIKFAPNLLGNANTGIRSFEQGITGAIG
jgi:hypothetical protein